MFFLLAYLISNAQLSSQLQIIYLLQYQSKKRMDKSRLDDWQAFLQFQSFREKVKLSLKLQSLLDYCEYIIHTQFDKNTKKKYQFKKRKIQVPQEHRNSIKELSQDQKLQYYLTIMKIIKSIVEGEEKDQFCEKSNIKENIISGDIYSRSYNLKIWKLKKLRLDRNKHILYAQKDDKIKTYDLEDYLLRISKNKDYHCFVLQAINNKPHQKSRTVHLGFKEAGKLEYWLKQLKIIYKHIYWNFIQNQIKEEGKKLYQSYVFGNKAQSRVIYQKQADLSKSMIVTDTLMMKNQEKSQKSNNIQIIKSQLVLSENKTPNQSLETVRSDNSFEEEEFKPRQRTKTIIQSLANIHADDEELEMIQQNQKQYEKQAQKQYQNIFNRILPEYPLQDIEKTLNYGSLFQQGPLRVLGHLQKHSKIKLFLSFSPQISLTQVMTMICIPQMLKKVNDAVEQVQIKTLIKSENSALIYHINKPYSKLYRPRDFLYLRHIFKKDDKLFMIDKSTQNINYPPFMTIVRGQLNIVWCIKKTQKQLLLIADIHISNQGYLNSTQDINLIMKFLKGFLGLEKFIFQNRQMLKKHAVFDYDWDISQKQEEEEKKQIINFKKKKIERSSQKVIKEQKQQKKKQVVLTEAKLPQKQKDIVLKQEIEEKKVQKQKVQTTQVTQSPFRAHLQNKIQQQKGQIDENQIQQVTVSEVQRQLDQNGMVIISQNFIHTKYVLEPLPQKEPQFQVAIKGHPIWKGQWIHDVKEGGIIFTNQKKIEDQKGVLRFILAKIGKNLIQRKSILQISLPVDIFCAQSNLQRLLYSMTYAHKFLQKAASESNILEKFKKVIGFGLSNSPLYLNMEKPFNPILGQTFQCWIHGCPAYAQQISHHPPIAALFFEGRGYRITAQLQSKVQLHMNSGCGTNQGIYRVKFKDELQVCFITAGGQVSGLTYGDRKFNIVGKSYFWIEKELIFIEIVFDPAKKGFFSVGKQQKPSDYFEGQVCFVTPEFMKNFLTSKKKPPSQKQITKKVGKVNGIWNKYLKFNDEVLLDIDKQFPVKLDYEANPLPSDANWRQDIQYRRLVQITKAQSEKERLQVLQRKDRKLRQKKKKK